MSLRAKLACLWKRVDALDTPAQTKTIMQPLSAYISADGQVAWQTPGTAPVTVTLVGTEYTVALPSPHPAGDQYPVQLSVVDDNNAGTASIPSVIDGTMTAAGFTVQLLQGDDGGGADDDSTDDVILLTVPDFTPCEVLVP